jgi:hypothetical protein
MIIIVTTIFLSIAILLSSFLGFSPNFYKLTENDFMRRANANTIIYGLQYADIALRAKTLAVPEKKNKTLPMEYIKKKGNRELDDMQCELKLTDDNKINVTIKYKQPK